MMAGLWRNLDPSSPHQTKYKRFSKLDPLLQNFLIPHMDTSVRIVYLLEKEITNSSENIRINHECEGRKEKSVPKITIWHHEACQVMTNGDPKGQIFLSYPHMNNGFFCLLTTVFCVFFLKISFQKSLNTLRYNFT